MAAYKPWTDMSFLKRKYITEKKTITQIAQECVDAGYSVTEMTIYNNLKKFNLIKNGRNLGSRSVGGSSKNGFYG